MRFIFFLSILTPIFTTGKAIECYSCIIGTPEKNRTSLSSAVKIFAETFPNEFCNKSMDISEYPTCKTQRNCIKSVVEEVNYSLPLEGKLHGGLTADHLVMRYMTSLYHLESLVCHSFLVSNRHILIPAHCVIIFFINNTPPIFEEYIIIVHGGLSQCRKISYELEQIERHLQFNTTKRNIARDVAVITLRTKVAPECGTSLGIGYGPNYEPKAEGTALAVGWVWYRNHRKELDVGCRILEMASLRILMHLYCIDRVKEGVICVTSDANFDSGDEGTPMIILDKVVGMLTSVFSGSDVLAAYTDIYKLRRDIEKLMTRRRRQTPMKVPRLFARFDWQLYNKPA